VRNAWVVDHLVRQYLAGWLSHSEFFSVIGKSLIRGRDGFTSWARTVIISSRNARCMGWIIRQNSPWQPILLRHADLTWDGPCRLTILPGPTRDRWFVTVRGRDIQVSAGVSCMAGSAAAGVTHRRPILWAAPQVTKSWPGDIWMHSLYSRLITAAYAGFWKFKTG
jgi:hypothetical protein